MTRNKTRFRHFQNVMSPSNPRTLDLNWGALDLTLQNLQGLDAHFSEQEVTNTLAQMLADKTPGLDGFTFNLYKSCYVLLKPTSMQCSKASIASIRLTFTF